MYEAALLLSGDWAALIRETAESKLLRTMFRHWDDRPESWHDLGPSLLSLISFCPDMKYYMRSSSREPY